MQGIKEVLSGSNTTIIDVRTDDVDDVRAKANAADTLVRYPDVKALGLWSYNGPAILNAVREAGKIGSVRIVTFDEADETLPVSRQAPFMRRLSSSRTSSDIRRSRGWRRLCVAIARSSRRRNRSSCRRWS